MRWGVKVLLYTEGEGVSRKGREGMESLCLNTVRMIKEPPKAEKKTQR